MRNVNGRTGFNPYPYRDSGGKGGSEKCDSSLDDNSFGDGNSEDPQQYVEGKKVMFLVLQNPLAT